MDKSIRSLNSAGETAQDVAEKSKEAANTATEAAQQIEAAFKSVSTTISSSLVDALEGVIVKGADLSTVFRALALDVGRSTLTAALTPLQTALGGAISGLVGTVLPFAKGGVVSGPTLFPAGSATGLMGEAGPEAILPLRRGADGALGVAAPGGGGGPSITVNIQTPDPEGFRRSRGQISAELARAVARGSRNL